MLECSASTVDKGSFFWCEWLVSATVLFPQLGNFMSTLSPKVICIIIIIILIIIKLNIQDSKTRICHIYHLNLE